MRANRGRTGPERALGTALWRRGRRYLTHVGYKSRYGKRLTGQPDLVFSKERTVVFVDGCFWHGCEDCGRAPPTMSKFWREKIATNVARDMRVTRQLEGEGWAVLRVPEHVLRTVTDLDDTANLLAAYLESESR